MAIKKVSNQTLRDTAGDLGGAWTTFTPTISGLTLGNASVSCAYTQIGKTVFCRGDITWGSTTSSNSTWSLTLPVAAKAGYSPTGSCFANNIGISYHEGTFKGNFFFGTESGSQWSQTVPFTWGTGDIFTWMIIYEAA